MERLRQLRKKANLTMKQLGAILSISDSAISQYEHGNRFPDHTTLLTLSNYFGVTIDYLLGNDDVSSTKSQLVNLINKELIKLNEQEQQFIYETVLSLQKNISSNDNKKLSAEVTKIINIANQINSMGLKQLLDFASRLEENYGITETVNKAGLKKLNSPV